MDGARPVSAGSGAGAPRGIPRGAPFFAFRGPSGALFHGAGSRDRRPRSRIAYLRARWARHIDTEGAGRPPFYGAPSQPLEIFSVRGHSSCRAPRARAHGPGRLRLHAASDGPSIYRGAVLCFAPFAGRSVSGGRPRRDLARVPSSTLDRAGRMGFRGEFFRRREGGAIQMPGASLTFNFPFPIGKGNHRSGSWAPAYLQQMSLQIYSAPFPWMTIDTVLHLRILYPLRRAFRRWADPGDLDMCTKYVGADSRHRAGVPLALLIPARRQPTGGPARVP